MCQSGVPGHPVHEFCLLGKLGLDPFGDVFAERAAGLKAEDRVRPGCHEGAEEAVDDTVGCKLVFMGPLRWLHEGEAES